MDRAFRFLIYAALFCFFTGITHAEISVVAFTGQAAPGNAGVTFSSLSGASVNNAGEMAFQAELSNGGTGIFKLSHGQLSTVALTGQSISGSPGLAFGDMGFPVINDSSTIAFVASIQGGASNLRGVFVASGTSVNKVLDTTATIPGTGDQITRGILSNLQLNDKGDIAVLVYPATSSPSAVLIISNGVISSVFPDASAFSLNNRGDIVIGTGSTLSLYSGGTTQLIARLNQSVSNTNLPLAVLGFPAVNDQDEIFFLSGNLSGPFGYLPPNALIRWRAGVLEKIVSNGDLVPGVSNASFFRIYPPFVDNSGRVFFVSLFYLNNNLSHGLFMYDGGSIILLAQDGQVLQGLGTFAAISYIGANDSGTVMFESSLDSGVSGIFRFDSIFNEIHFPRVADGSFENQWLWRTTLILSNRDNSASASVTVNFINDDGTPMNVGIQSLNGSQFSFVIPASGSLQVETTGGGNVKTGWARVQSDKILSGISIFSLYDGTGNYVSEVGTPATSSLNAFSLFVESRTDVNTAIALTNPNDSAAQATLTLIDEQGKSLGSPINRTVPGNGQIAGYLTDLFQGSVPPDFHGTIKVVSQLPIIGLNLRQRKDVFTWLPSIQ